MADFYEVVPSSVRHIKALAAELRPAACQTLRAFGADPRRALHHAVRQSHYCRTAILKGQPVAMWGAAGAMLGDTVIVWGAFTLEAVRFPLAIVRGARSELAKLGRDGTSLHAMVAVADDKAILFAQTIGFDRTNEFEVPDGMVAMSFGRPAWLSH